ncbi:ABC transporter permease [Avibacterium paragallinarum]|uniref:ABC transporter permease n=1 Tax=Avibacterium paragallinarum TaxID=728 RepID=UPI00398A34F8
MINKLPKFLDNSLFWVLFALIGFIFLPSMALQYGLLDSSFEEIYKSMGWYSVNISWIWFGGLLLFPLYLYVYKKRTLYHQGLTEFYISLVLFLFIIISAKLTEFNLGYATFVMLLSLIAIAANGLVKIRILQGDKFIILSLICIILIVTCFIIYPAIMLLISIHYDSNEFTSLQFEAYLNKSYILRLIINSLSVSISVGILSTLFGLILALYTTRIAKHNLIISKIFSILPIITPPFVIGLGIILMLGRTGYITELFIEYLGFNNNWLYGFTGITIAHTLAFTPLAFMILEGALRTIHPSIEEAAYSLGASPYQVLLHILFPLLKPAFANAFLVITIQSLADFSTPLILGGNFDVISSQIYLYITGSQLDYTSASILGSFLLLFSLIIFITQYLWIRNGSYTSISGKSSYWNIQDLPFCIKILVISTFLGWSLFNALLYGSIFYGSFTKSWGIDYTFTLNNYLILFGQGFQNGAWPSLINTILFSIIAAPLSTILGFLIAYITTRCDFRGKKSLELLVLLCFSIPGTVIGLSYIIAFNDAPIYLIGSSTIIITSMIIRNIPIGMRTAIASLKQIDKSLEEASMSLTANSLHTIKHIIFPLIKPTLFAALTSSFVRSMTTVSAIIFLVTTDTRVATSYILNRVEDGEYGIATSYGAMLILVMILIILLFEWAMRNTYTSYFKAKIMNS